jgi:outer membrane protein assembly factor BamD
MKGGILRVLLVAAGLMALPVKCYAPLVYRPGEGWTYEPVGGARWERARAKDQYEVAKEAFDKKEYGLAAKAARRTVRKWPLSDYAPQAQYLLGRCYEVRKWDERAFKEYQLLVEKYPKVENYDEVLQRQYAIAARFLGGQWFKLWGVLPFFPSMEKTAEMFAKIVRNGAYSPVAPQAQLSIGAAREKQKDFYSAVQAYERAADVYHDQKSVAADATYKAGMSYYKEAKAAEYDQSAAGQAIATLNDFIVLFPNDARAGEAQKTIAQLRTEQARGAYKIARFYEKKKKWDGALVYYNEVLLRDSESSYAADAKRRIEALKSRGAKSPGAK